MHDAVHKSAGITVAGMGQRGAGQKNEREKRGSGRDSSETRVHRVASIRIQPGGFAE
jgi:hypothetical protein